MLKVVASFLSAHLAVMGPVKDINCFHYITRYLACTEQIWCFFFFTSCLEG